VSRLLSESSSQAPVDDEYSVASTRLGRNGQRPPSLARDPCRAQGSAVGSREMIVPRCPASRLQRHPVLGATHADPRGAGAIDHQRTPPRRPRAAAAAAYCPRRRCASPGRSDLGRGV
jgi:hypothetical protein